MFLRDTFIRGVHERSCPLTELPFFNSTVTDWFVAEGKFIRNLTNFIAMMYMDSAPETVMINGR